MQDTSKFNFKGWHFMPLLLLVFFFGSCVSMSTMQTGRTVGKGNSELNIGGSAIKLETIFDSDSTDLNGGVLEGDFRYGVTDKLDVGMKVALIGPSGGYAKYQLVGDDESKFALSAGVGGGYLTIESGEGENKTKSTVVDLYVPVYTSVHPTDWLSLYAAPRYNMRIGGGTSHWYGGTGGIRLGKRFAGFAEYSWVNSADAIKPLRQITGGISIGFGE